MQKATRVERFLASLIDTLIMVVILIPIIFLEGGVEADVSSFRIFIDNIVIIIIFMAINWKLLITNGQTIGKKVMNIKIIRSDGSNIDKDTILKRYGLYFGLGLVPFIGGLLSLADILFIFREDKRCIHDLFADTIVVQV